MMTLNLLSEDTSVQYVPMATSIFTLKWPERQDLHLISKVGQSGCQILV